MDFRCLWNFDVFFKYISVLKSSDCGYTTGEAQHVLPAGLWQFFSCKNENQGLSLTEIFRYLMYRKDDVLISLWAERRCGYDIRNWRNEF